MNFDEKLEVANHLCTHLMGSKIVLCNENELVIESESTYEMYDWCDLRDNWKYTGSTKVLQEAMGDKENLIN